MKDRLSVVALLLVFIVSTLFMGMAQRPKSGSREWYLNRPYELNNPCFQYGNPWTPTGTAPSKKYPDGIPPLQSEKFYACAKPYWDYAAKCFAWDAVKKKSVPVPNCPLQKPE